MSIAADAACLVIRKTDVHRNEGEGEDESEGLSWQAKIVEV